MKRLLKTYWNYPIVKMLQNMHTRFALPHLISIARPKKEFTNQLTNNWTVGYSNRSLYTEWSLVWFYRTSPIILPESKTSSMDIVFRYTNIPYGLIADRFPTNVSLLLHTLHRLRMCARVRILRTVRSVQE